MAQRVKHHLLHRGACHHELIWIPESEDLDNPKAYIEGMDFVYMLKGIGYKPFGIDGVTKVIPTAWKESPRAGHVRITAVPNRGDHSLLSACVIIDYSAGGFSRYVASCYIPYMDVPDKVREFESLIADPSVACVSQYVYELGNRHSDLHIFTADMDQLYDTFGESVLQEAADADDPAVYIERLKKQADASSASLYLINLQPAVRRIFQVAKIDSVLLDQE